MSFIISRMEQCEALYIRLTCSGMSLAILDTARMLYACQRFLLCDALRCTVFGIVILSVRPSRRPSVCLSVSHTRALCPHGSTYDHDSSPYGSPIILVSAIAELLVIFYLCDACNAKVL